MAIGVLANVGLPVVEQAHSEEKCSLATLKGTYLFAHGGYVLTDQGMVPKAVTGSNIFFGDGKFSDQETISTNGMITTEPPGSGTYTVNRDCTGILSPSPTKSGNSVKLQMFISPNGLDIVDIEIDPGSVLSGTQHRVAR